MARLVTTGELAKALDVTRDAVAHWRRLGVPTAGKRGKANLYDVDEVRRWREEHLSASPQKRRDASAGQAGPAQGGAGPKGPSKPSYNDARTAKLLMEVQGLRIKNRRLAGELVEVEAARDELAALIAKARSIVDAFPASAARDLCDDLDLEYKVHAPRVTVALQRVSDKLLHQMASLAFSGRSDAE